MVEIRERIREALATRGMTASDLSKKSGIGKGSISKYLKGLVTPKQSAIGSMAKALDVSPAWLMGYDVPMKSTLPAGGFHGGDVTYRVDEMRLLNEIQKLDDNEIDKVLAYVKGLQDSKEDK